MNYTKLFYWLVVADNARVLFTVFTILFTAIFVVSMLIFIVGRTEEDWTEKSAKHAKKWRWYSTPLMLFFWMLFVFTPNKKDALLIVAGGQTLNFLTTDSTARKIPSEALNFVVTELKSMAKEAEVDLGINDQKDRIIEEAKMMTTVELLDKMKTDTLFTKVILGK